MPLQRWINTYALFQLNLIVPKETLPRSFTFRYTIFYQTTLMWQIFSGRKSLSIVIWKVIMKLKAKSADLLLVHLRRWFLRLFPLKLLDQLLWFLWSAHFILKSHQSVVIQELSYSVVKTSCLYQLITKVNNSPFCPIVFIWECFHYFLSSYLQPDTEDKYPRIEKTGGKVIQWQVHVFPVFSPY